MLLGKSSYLLSELHDTHKCTLWSVSRAIECDTHSNHWRLKAYCMYRPERSCLSVCMFFLFHLFL